MARTTQTERAAVESLAGRITKQQREWGEAGPSGEAARQRAVKIAERSAAEKRENGRGHAGKVGEG